MFQYNARTENKGMMAQCLNWYFVCSFTIQEDEQCGQGKLAAWKQFSDWQNTKAEIKGEERNSEATRPDSASQLTTIREINRAQ